MAFWLQQGSTGFQIQSPVGNVLSAAVSTEGLQYAYGVYTQSIQHFHGTLFTRGGAFRDSGRWEGDDPVDLKCLQLTPL